MFQRIWVCGDIHGSYLPIENFYNKYKDSINFSKETDCIILLGDVGTNFFLTGRDRKFKYKLGKYPFTYFLIRGNHEVRVSFVISQDPTLWHTETFFDNTVYVEDNYPYLKYASDTISIYNIEGHKTLVIPGAYSVDKYYRLTNQLPWFKDEQLSTEEMEQGRRLIEENDYNFDLILSHTCPISYEPTDLFLSFIDQSTVDKTMERYLGWIEFNTDYKFWLWGHFHHFRVYPEYNGRQCIMLSAGDEMLNLKECFENKDNIYKIY